MAATPSSRFGWHIESERPLVLLHSDGSQATGDAAASILRLIAERQYERISTPQLHAIWWKGKEGKDADWMRSGYLDGQGHVATYSKEPADRFVDGLGEDFVVRPVYLMTPPLDAD